MFNIRKFMPVLFSVVAVILLSIIIISIFNFNLSFNFAGGVQYQIRVGEKISSNSTTVDMTNNDYKELKNKIKEVLKDNKVSGSIDMQGTGSNKTYVVRIINNKFKTIDGDKILADFNNKITNLIDYDSSFEKIEPSVPFKFVLWTIITIIILMALVFLTLLLSVNIYAGIFAAVGVLFNSILMLSLICVTRIPFDTITLAICLIGSVWFAIEATSQFMRIHAEWKERHNEEGIVDISNKFINNDFSRNVIFTIIFIVMAGGLSILNLANLSLIFVPVASFVSLTFMVYPLFALICENKKVMPKIKSVENAD